MPIQIVSTFLKELLVKRDTRFRIVYLAAFTILIMYLIALTMRAQSNQTPISDSPSVQISPDMQGLQVLEQQIQLLSEQIVSMQLMLNVLAEENRTLQQAKLQLNSAFEQLQIDAKDITLRNVQLKDQNRILQVKLTQQRNEHQILWSDAKRSVTQEVP